MKDGSGAAEDVARSPHVAQFRSQNPFLADLHGHAARRMSMSLNEIDGPNERKKENGKNRNVSTFFLSLPLRSFVAAGTRAI